MTQVTPTDFLSDSVMRRINYRVNRLGRKFGLSREDREDLRQNFCLAMICASKRFDPQKCTPDRFVKMVLNRHYKYYVRKLTHRVDDCVCSIDAMVPDESDPDYDQFLVDPKSGDDRRRWEISEDMKTLYSLLPVELSEFCHDLQHNTPSEVARRWNVHPSTVYRAIDELRKHFLKAGIDELF